MKKILNIIFVLIITLLTSCNSKYAYAELEVITYQKRYENVETIAYVLNFPNSEKTKIVYAELDLSKYGIDYLLIGDVLKVKTDAIRSSVNGEHPLGISFNKVRRVKIDRRKTLEFEVKEYESDGNLKKEIVCTNKNANICVKYKDQNEKIITNHTLLDENYPSGVLFYETVKLQDLDVGTRLVGTFSETYRGLVVDDFYLKSYIK